MLLAAVQIEPLQPQMPQIESLQPLNWTFTVPPEIIGGIIFAVVILLVGMTLIKRITKRIAATSKLIEETEHNITRLSEELSQTIAQAIATLPQQWQNLVKILNELDSSSTPENWVEAVNEWLHHNNESKLGLTLLTSPQFDIIKRIRSTTWNSEQAKQWKMWCGDFLYYLINRNK